MNVCLDGMVDEYPVFIEDLQCELMLYSLKGIQERHDSDRPIHKGKHSLEPLDLVDLNNTVLFCWSHLTYMPSLHLDIVFFDLKE